ncbi:DUF6153 family protein [Amycolatopsis pigmentata]|uniref:DUF6153 family protein n=1 Tax=Amycolatopsis pigmentata TaxID=450801 RepID=A0ABW5G357_9PSEU
MRDRRQARAGARLLIVCAVLTGLFLMHGLSAQACTASTDMPATTMTTGATAAHGDQASRVLAQSEQAAAPHAVHGATCLFTPAPRGSDVFEALSLLALAVALMSLAGWDLGGRYPRTHRAPPRTGSRLLTTLCVSRT